MAFPLLRKEFADDRRLPDWLRPPTSGPAVERTVRVAFLGRTSTDEQQDPTLSIPRQLANSERALLPGMVIVARFYDVESSRKELSQRGRSDAWQKFDIGVPRVVAEIVGWRVDEKLSFRTLAERLNTDLHRYPPPEPVDPARAVGRWTASAVREILRNPKYTGHMVWNRRSTKDKLHPGKYNRREEWVVSPTPTHPEIISVELYTAAQDLTKYRRSPSGSTRSPHARTIYPLRSFVMCEMCGGRRMHGKTNHARTQYYYCQPRERDRPEGHPVGIWLREDDLLDRLTTFFNRHILGHDRLTLVRRSFDATAVRLVEDHGRRVAAVRRAVDDLRQRLNRLTMVLEERDARTAPSSAASRPGSPISKHNCACGPPN
jgi:hypothetical protein